MKPEVNNYNDTIFLRFCAILLILNSHLDAYYPIAHIGTGGAIGNTLFFMLSSLGIFMSFQKKPEDLVTWYSNRVRRIYPSVWLTLILIVQPIDFYTGNFHFFDFFTFAKDFFYPPFWFLQALMIFYFIGWFILANFSEKNFFTILLIAFAFYTCLYPGLDLNVLSIENLPFKIIYYLIVYLFGMYMAFKNESIQYTGISDFIFGLAFLIAIYFHKYLMTKSILTEFQFIQQIFCILLGFYLLKISRSSLIKEKLMKSVFSKYIKYVGGMTLEIYLVHVSISSLILDLHLLFPLNLIIFLLFVLALSAVLQRLSKALVFSRFFFPIAQKKST